jgi:hypothetical protein
MKPEIYIKRCNTFVTAVLISITLANHAWAFSTGSHHSFLSGPWELVVKLNLEGDGLRFPLTVSDENKPQKFDTLLPVMETPIKVRLEEYVPDLCLETIAVNYSGEGIVAKLNIKGKDLKQDIWLSSANLSRQSISSSVGSVAIRRFHDPGKAEKLVRELIQPMAFGTLSIWPEDSNSPFEYVAKVAETITIPNSKYKLSILDYVPHYSIDTMTKKVVNLSEEPINPAIKVSLTDGDQVTEQWLWANFSLSPHKKNNLPLRVQFTDFNLNGIEGKYFLAVAHEAKPWFIVFRKGGKIVEGIVLGRFYPFANEEYSFSVEKIIDGAIIKTEWKNNTESLLHPAIIATIEQNSSSHQTALELNKPFHYKTEYGTLVLLFRRSPEFY